LAAHAAYKSVGEGTSGFLAVGPGDLKIEGTGTGVTASENGGKITVKAPLTNLKTGISLRDDHLKKAIKADVNKYATFTVERSAVSAPAGKETTGKGKGQFALNGVTKDVDFDYKATPVSGGAIEVQGRASFDMTHFKLEQPCYLGVCVDKEIKVKVKFKVTE
jgi:polyisoprenoid-binding protein YceI